MGQKEDKLVTQLAGLARQMLALCESGNTEQAAIPEAAAKERDRRLKRKQCLQCEVIETEDGQFRRGLNDSCYQATLREINTGKKTWDDYVAEGLALPAGKGGRPPKRKRRIPAETSEEPDPLTIKIEAGLDDGAIVSKLMPKPAKKGKGKK